MSGRGRFGPEAQRFLDGAPGDVPDAAERSEGERLLAATHAYRDGLRPLDASLDDRVMAAIRSRAQVPRPTGWRWFVEPHVVRVRPMWIPALAAAALALWVGGRALRPSDGAGVPMPVAVAARDTVFVRFEVSAPGARAVAVAGSFNGWRPESLPMTRGPSGEWAVTVPLALGEHQYQFVVDGERWIPDPGAYSQTQDGFGGTNSVIVVGARGVVRS